MYGNMETYFIHACRISHISYMKIRVYTFVEWIPLLLIFQEKQHFTLTSNDTNSCNFVLVNHEFHLDLQGDHSQTSMCFRITWTALWSENISCHINKQEISQPSVTSGLQMWMRAPPNCDPAVCVGFQHHFAEELGEGKKQDEWDRIAKVHMKGRRAASSSAQNAKFLSLIPDLCCSDCLLPLLQTCI